MKVEVKGKVKKKSKEKKNRWFLRIGVEIKEVK